MIIRNRISCYAESVMCAVNQTFFNLHKNNKKLSESFSENIISLIETCERKKNENNFKLRNPIENFLTFKNYEIIFFRKEK